MAANYIKAAKDRMDVLQNEHMADKLLARDHQINEVEMFRRNERSYIAKLNSKIERQNELMKVSSPVKPNVPVKTVIRNGYQDIRVNNKF